MLEEAAEMVPGRTAALPLVSTPVTVKVPDPATGMTVLEAVVAPNLANEPAKVTVLVARAVPLTEIVIVPMPATPFG